MKGMQHANKVQTTYRARRKGLNNRGKEKDRTASRKRKRGRK